MINTSTTVIILGGLALFLYGMKVMSESLQMATGDGLRSILAKITNNRLAGLLTGFTITGLIQSSSATTVMLVSFVNAGLISLEQSIGIIFGANIGTTITAWLVAVLGFKVKITTFCLPAIAIGFSMRFFNFEKMKYWGEVLIGFGLLFLGLSFMSSAVSDLSGSSEVMHYMSMYKADNLLTTIIVIIVAAVVTMLIQSSSATMAMTMTLAVNGLIDFNTACGLILGENIGTTITANIASIGTSVSARRTARVHMLFNLLGIVWILITFNLFLSLVDWIVPGDISKFSTVPDHMAAFHTSFNVINAIIFLPFVKQLSWIVKKIVPDKNKKDKEEHHLKYISTSLLSTPSININQSWLEIKHMTEIIEDMFDQAMNVFENPDVKLGKIVEEIQIKENRVDILEKEISSFLVKISQHQISTDESHEISTMLHIVNELERIGDHCESLLKLIRKKYDSNIIFSTKAIMGIEEISGKVREFIKLLIQNIAPPHKNILAIANVIENRIDELRKEAKKQHIDRITNDQCDVVNGLLFIDMLNSFEKIGDHAYNVAEGISGIRIF